MTQPAAHAWFRPKLVAMLAEAQAAGIGRDVSVAVVTDLINGELAGVAAAPGDEGWNQDIGESLGMVNGPPRTAPDQSSGAMVSNPLNRVDYEGV